LALQSFNSTLVDAAALAQFAKLLIATEAAPGGPYRTWLVKSDGTQWQDIDIVVNANIGVFFSRQGVELAGLNSFLDEAIQKNTLTSPYYVSSIPSLYFLSRWYKGPQLNALQKLVADSLDASKTHTSLQLALLITAARNIQLPASKIASARRRLLALRHDGHWPAEALYVDPHLDGQQYYAGSAALTTAFALEALSEIHSEEAPKKTLTVTSPTIRAALASSKSLPAELGTAYQNIVRQIAARDHDGQISDMATLTARAYDRTADKKMLEQLNLGSLNGWIAYSIYDDFLDEEGQPALLSAAHYALRQSVTHFAQALPDNVRFTALVDDAFVAMDTANLWEVTQARATAQKGRLHYTLPTYGDYRQLAERSWGHSLAACGVLMAGNSAAKVPQLQKFFHHFLIARQLNDDAHDWEEDLARGHLSAVACLLLKEHGAAGSINLKTELPVLRQIFWRSTIHVVAELITSHSSAARKALTQSDIASPKLFLDWLTPLEASAERAVAGSQETQKFILEYQK
jgi:hypothetical protein